MNRITLLFTFLMLCVSLVGCKAKQPSADVSVYYQKQNADVNQSMADCTARITMHMMESPAFTQGGMPKIILGRVTNTTGDDALPIHIAENAMKQVVIKSKKAQILPHEAPEFDYITHVAIHYEENQDGSQRQNSSYTIRVQLLNYYGELIGQWSAKTSSF